jgi:beta-fructofuranosidase
MSPATPNRSRHRPRFHFTPASGWLNDPNGVCFHAGRYHLFYQHNPAAPRWGDIHWGHASSADLVQWRDEPIALKPGPGPDQDGCYSGSFALVSGVPTLYYTGCAAGQQVQCVATSADMQQWAKQPGRAVVTPPTGVSPADFRDPYVFQHQGRWHMVVGASLHGERGTCLLYTSADGIAWTYRHALYTAPSLALGVMWECPNFFPLGDKWVLTVSVWPRLGAHSFVGRFEAERFVPESDVVLDSDGGAFAHLAFTAPDGRCLQWAWIDEQREQAAVDADGWAGALSVPRRLWLDTRARLNQAPAEETTSLRRARLGTQATGATRGVLHTFSGACLDIEARYHLRSRHKLGLAVCASPDGREFTRIVFWPEARRLVVERAHSSLDAGARRQDVHALLVLEEGEDLHLRVLLDHSVIEVFANQRLCISTRVYPSLPASTGCEVFADGDADLLALDVWAMGSIHGEPRRGAAH